ncbi:MAG: L,D-transpeptidase [Hyphomicrobiales bacterium]|nr:MAG: L,D-transpeptidase [Hyphomicrobiales bacterium]
MKRFVTLFAMSAIGLAAFCSTSEAGQARYGSNPPLLLSPNLTEPWLLQLRPGRHAQQPRRVERRKTRLYRDTQMAVPHRTFREPPHQRPVQQVSLQARPRVAAKPKRSISPEFMPTTVSYDGPHKPGTIVINTDERYLYLVEQGGKARRYGVGVGRPGFEWAGTHKITRKAEWPGWTPPEEMRQRQPGLPQYMEGGPNNPLGARALYLGSTLYRIHGSNQPWTIGHAVSSGCIRMRNQDVTELYERVGVGTKVIVR